MPVELLDGIEEVLEQLEEAQTKLLKKEDDLNKLSTTLSEKENEIYNFLKKSLDSVPDLPKENHNGWKERGKQVKQSNKFNLIWQLNTK
mgnify:CR=1 FL=1